MDSHQRTIKLTRLYELLDSDIDLTMKQLKILVLIATHSGLIHRQLQVMSGLLKSDVANILRSLSVKKTPSQAGLGLIKMEAYGLHKRSYLTDKGEEFITKLISTDN